MNAPIMAPEALSEQEAQIVLAFLDEPLLYTSQEDLDRGNETRAAFFLDTIEFLEQETGALDLQLMREEDPEERLELEKSKSEMESLERDVRQLALALVTIGTSGGNNAAAKKQIAAHGSKLFAQIREASEKGRQRLRFAIGDDGAMAEELALRKKRLLQERDVVVDMSGQSNTLIAGLTLLSWLLDSAHAEAADRQARLAEQFSQMMSGTGLDTSEVEYLANRRAEKLLSQHEQALLDYRSGKLSTQDVYNQLVHHQTVQLLNDAPQQMRMDYLASVIPLSTFNQSVQERLAGGLTADELAAILPQGESAAQFFTKAIDAYQKDLANTEKWIAIAENDIARAIQGDPLNTEALEQLFNTSEVEAIQEKVKTAAAAYKPPLSNGRTAEAEKSHEALLKTLNPDRGFTVGDMNGFADRMKHS